MDSYELLRAYATNGSEEAFRELVTRYCGLVHSTALRLTQGDAHRAQDVVQTVFADLSRNSKKISPQVMLGGWLHQRTFHVTTSTLRSERRRQAREQEAAEMNILEDHSVSDFAGIAPFLDKAITQLTPVDQTAIYLRFFERLDLRSIGQALGSNEDAAQKRISRALDKLRLLLTRKGVVLSAAGLASALSLDTLTAAPAGLASGVATGALASAATGTLITITVLKSLIMSKVNSAALAAVLVIGMGAVIIQQYRANRQLQSEIQSLEQQAPLSNSEPPAQITPAVRAKPPEDIHLELLRLRGQIGVISQENQRLRSNRTALLSLAKMLRDPLDLDQFPDSYNLVNASSATNAGTATPAALLQTWLWAQRTIDIDGRARTTDWPEAISDVAKSEEINRWAESQERRADTPPSFEEYRLIALWPLGDDIYLATFAESKKPTIKVHTGKQFFRKTADGWRVTSYVPEQGAFLQTGGRWLEYE